MDHFNYQDGVLCAEDVSLESLAQAHGTPLYVYSRATLERHWKAFDDALGNHPHLVCYAVKANSSLAVLNVLARLGAGFDIVSGGELERVLRAGGDPGRVVFSGVGKQVGEMRRALQVGIRCFNVESVAELERLNREAGALGMIAPVSIRVNPDVDAGTHPYISTGLKENKFGVDVEDALDLYRQAAALPHLKVAGLDCHIGSQLTSLDPFVDALRRVILLTRALQAEGIQLEHLDLGGGLGIRYQNETPPSPRDYAQAMLAELKDTGYEILLEPGRAIAGNAGVLVTRVEYLKPTRHKDFAIVDAAMNDLIRPALYDAWMDILPVRPRSGESREYDVVGPVCETGDFLGKGRSLVLEQGDLLAVRSAGAYGYVMSSNYNTRARAAEVMVEGEKAHVITRRETLEDLLARETVLPE
ncbi:diaminopimelate decarboxylase [Ectothiorhodospira variabilis]|uniref:diaminopimelate decarboxylase n=1 Tax=Ectothiorhodospira variabilis TaxID=505694 RepID=UPI001EFAD96A|nr:diaminopimelate decarboxylase [Ectothiorhodospira variabilis]MCG5494952.1 diaminopimelate decarboxylase [Ectothiorhodospira variabilis]MCG5504465.1 diaminopimelate decarboxylase [Ectothiorhodospira variabilis]MCG5507669.1 diaminopimelate decarboxylase [Ectothiorhodospira variabilis]